MKERVLDFRGKYRRRQVTKSLTAEIKLEVESFLASCGIDIPTFNQGRKGTAALTRELLYDDVYLLYINSTVVRVAKTVTGFVILNGEDLICEAGRFSSTGEQTRGSGKKGLSETLHHNEPDKKAFKRGIWEEWGLRIPLKQIFLLFDPTRSQEDIQRDVVFLTAVCGVSLQELMWQSNLHQSTAYHSIMTYNIVSVVVLHLNEWPFPDDLHIVTDNETVIHITRLSSLNPIPSSWEELLELLPAGAHSEE